MLKENTICFPGNFDCFQNTSARVVCEVLLVITSAGNSEAVVHRCSTISVLKFLNSKENSCVGGREPATLFKKRLRRSCFSVKFAKLFRKPFSQNTSGRLHPETVQKILYLRSIEHSNAIDQLCRKLQRMLSDTQVQVQRIVPSLSEAAVYSIQLFFYSIQNRCL